MQVESSLSRKPCITKERKRGPVLGHYIQAERARTIHITGQDHHRSSRGMSGHSEQAQITAGHVKEGQSRSRRFLTSSKKQKGKIQGDRKNEDISFRKIFK